MDNVQDFKDTDVKFFGTEAPFNVQALISHPFFNLSDNASIETPTLPLFGVDQRTAVGVLSFDEESARDGRVTLKAAIQYDSPERLEIEATGLAVEFVFETTGSQINGVWTVDTITPTKAFLTYAPSPYGSEYLAPTEGNNL